MLWISPHIHINKSNDFCQAAYYNALTWGTFLIEGVDGFDGKFSWAFSPSECGGDLRGPTGTFTSPSYPNPNPHGRICEWSITVQEGRRITLTFNNLRLEAHPSCASERVTVSVLCSQGCHVPLFKKFIDS